MKGLIAALPTPVRDDGCPDLATLDRVIDFVAAAGVDGICVGGATGEYPHVETADRLAVIRRAAEQLPRGLILLVGIGASSLRRTIELGRCAIDHGAHATLLPAPIFYRYQQEDLQAYVAHVTRTLAAPCLLYDLPEFNTPLVPATAFALLRDEEFIIGIKDSSGRTEHLTMFVAARAELGWTLLAGDDRLTLRALQAGWDGGVSGIAAFCPELPVALFRSHARGDADEAARLQKRLDELVARVVALPAPWGVRAGLAARGFDTGPLPLPLSANRERQIREFTEWLAPWMRDAGSAMRDAGSVKRDAG